MPEIPKIMDTDACLAAIEQVNSSWVRTKPADRRMAHIAASILAEADLARLPNAQKLRIWKQLGALLAKSFGSYWFRIPPTEAQIEWRTRIEACRARIESELAPRDMSPTSTYAVVYRDLTRSRDPSIRKLARTFYDQITDIYQNGRKVSAPERMRRAINAGNLDLVKLLLKEGVKPNVKLDSQSSLLKVALDATLRQPPGPERETQWRIVEAMIRAGGNPNICIGNTEENSRQSLLQLAVLEGRTPLVLQLLRRKAEWRPAGEGIQKDTYGYSITETRLFPSHMPVSQELTHKRIQAFLHILLRQAVEDKSRWWKLPAHHRPLVASIIQADLELSIPDLVSLIPTGLLRNTVCLRDICSDQPGASELRRALANIEGYFDPGFKDFMSRRYPQEAPFTVSSATPVAQQPTTQLEESLDTEESVAFTHLQFGTDDPILLTQENRVALDLLVADSNFLSKALIPGIRASKEGVSTLPLHSVSKEAMDWLLKHVQGKPTIHIATVFHTNPKEHQRLTREIGIAAEALQLQSLKALRIGSKDIWVLSKNLSPGPSFAVEEPETLEECLDAMNRCSSWWRKPSNDDILQARAAMKAIAKMQPDMLTYDKWLMVWRRLEAIENQGALRNDVQKCQEFVADVIFPPHDSMKCESLYRYWSHRSQRAIFRSIFPMSWTARIARAIESRDVEAVKDLLKEKRSNLKQPIFEPGRNITLYHQTILEKAVGEVMYYGGKSAREERWRIVEEIVKAGGTSTWEKFSIPGGRVFKNQQEIRSASLLEIAELCERPSLVALLQAKRDPDAA